MTRPRRSWLAALLAAIVACGPTGRGTETTPTLPGDEPGDDDTPRPKPKPVPAPEADPWAGRTDLIAAPELTPPAPVNLPKIERFTLPNGLQVLVVENHDLPVASFHLAVRAGVADETREKRGLADFAAAMLTKGTRTRSADEIAQTIDYIGGALEASADFEATHLTCESLAKDLKTCLTLLPDVAMAAAFPEAELAEVRDQLVSYVKQLRDNPDALANEHFENALWGEDHVRGWPVTVETVSAITRKDLVAWHAARFKPGNAILAVAGDVDAKQLKGQLAKAFAPWKKGAAPARKKYPEPKLDGRRVRLVDKPDQTQSQIVLGHLGIAHGDADYFPTILMNYTLGGGAFSSRLMKVVRAQGGKTYGASSAFERWRSRGTFQAQTFTRNDETLSTLGLVVGEIQRMREGGPTAAELADAQSNVAGNYPLSFESASRVAAAVLSAELHGLGEAYVREFPVRVAAVSLTAAKKAALEHLDPENLVIVIVGRAEEVAPQLKAAGLDFEVVGYLEPISKRDRDAKRAARSAPADPKKAAEGRKLLETALGAKGGLSRLKKLQDVTTKGKFVVRQGGRTIEGAYGRWFKVPDMLREDIEVPGQGTAKMVLTATEAFVDAGGQKQDIPQQGADILRGSFWHQPEMILLRAAEPGAILQAAGKEPIGGVDYDALVVRSADGANEAKLLFDPKTHLIFRVVYEIDGQPTYDELGEYKAVNGLQIAHRMRTENPLFSVVLEITYTDVKVDSGLGEDVFAK